MLKLKAWNKAEEKMCAVKSLDFDNSLIVVRFPEFDSEHYGEEYNDSMELDKFELIEYIGLNDRVNNKEIYDGYIVKALNRYSDNEDNWRDYFETFEVTYLNGCWMFGNWNAHEFFNRFIYIEVIGNRFEGIKED